MTEDSLPSNELNEQKHAPAGGSGTLQPPDPPVDSEKGNGESTGTQLAREPSAPGPVHSIFSPAQRRYVAFCASAAGFFSPLSANIYLPALNTLARKLNVGNSMVNLTITSYMIFQGLAPMFIGDFADTAGRRPAYLLCFTIYIGANIGLALQNHYAALFVLRCLQSTGCSATIALSAGVVADVATAARRGSYMGLVTAGSLLGPSLGPVIGGLLAQFLGWRAIFWFLVITAAVFLSQLALLFPETSRKIVGDGSIPPPRWNLSVISYLKTRKTSTNVEAAETITRPKLRFPNPIRTLLIVFQKDSGIILLCNALLFAGFYDVTASLPSLFAEIYGFNDLQIGLCYLPIGVGSACASIANGFLLDYNYKRIAKKVGIRIVRNKQQDLRHFPIEKARLQVTFPLLVICCCTLASYGWLLQVETSVAAPLIILFILGTSLTGAFNTMSTLIVDLHPGSAATATASNNLCRCLLGAGATALISPMLNGLGRGWCFTLLAFVMAATAPLLFAEIHFGPRWREERRVRDEQRRAEGRNS